MVFFKCIPRRGRGLAEIMASQGKGLLPGPAQGPKGAGAVLLGLQEGGALPGDLQGLRREGGAWEGLEKPLEKRRRRIFAPRWGIEGGQDRQLHHAPGPDLAGLRGGLDQLSGTGGKAELNRLHLAF
jgi:hypothetical protein